MAGITLLTLKTIVLKRICLANTQTICDGGPVSVLQARLHSSTVVEQIP